MAKRKKKQDPLLVVLGTIAAIVLLLFEWITSDGFVVEVTGPGETARPPVASATEQPVYTSRPANPSHPSAAPQEKPDRSGMTLHVLEVGKADCLLLECDGEWMLVDGGNEDDEAYVLEKLSEMGVEEFKYLVNTHPHEDHLGTLDAVIYAYDVEQAFISPKDHTTPNYERLITALAEREVDTSMPHPGDEWQLGGATLTVLSPAHDADYEGYNDWSIVLMCQYGDVRYLLTGDAETPVEGDLVDSGIDLKADVLKVGHHGSATSSRKNFLAAVSPSYALITCDGTEEAGAPHEKVVRYLEEYSIPFLRTDENGVISVWTDGTDIALDTERETVIR